jgi:hypothetical protein
VTPSPRRHLLWSLVPARRPRVAGRTQAVLATVVATLACSACLSALAPSASAKVVSIETTESTEKFGVEARNAYAIGEVGAEPLTFENLSGHPVLHSASTYVIYWDPTATYDNDWQQLIDEFVHNMSVSGGEFHNVFVVDSQYRDSSNKPATAHSSFHGAYTDTNPYPAPGCTDPEALEIGALTCLSDTQVRAQLEAFIAEHSLPKGMGAIYYMLTPPGVTVCLDEGGESGNCSDHVENQRIVEHEAELPEAKNESYRNSFCSYHGAITPTSPETGDANTILYGMIPWTAGNVGGLGTAPFLQAYDCQDGAFDPTAEPTGKKERASQVARKNEEQKERQEKLATEEKCNTAEEKATGEKKEQIESECEAEIELIEEIANRELEAIAKQQAREEPHIQEPNQSGLDLDGDFDAALPDVLTNEIAVQQQNIVTDPLLNAWHDGQGYEVTDECRNWFWTNSLNGTSIAEENTDAGTVSNQTLGSASYYLNDAFLLGGVKLDYPGGGCQNFIDLAPHFTAPNDVNSGEVVGFNGMESAVTLNWAGLSLTAPEQTYATFTWNFGDGSPEVSGYAPGAPQCKEPWLSPCAASVFHTYAYGGVYRPTLTITDTGGNVFSTTEELTVNGPAKPSAGGGEGGGGGGGGGSAGAGSSPSPGGSTGGGSPSGGASSSTVIPPPTARAAAAKTSLRNAIKRGLKIHYSVNEQVAGTIEVLLNAATAKHLHLRGPVASGLPAGSPRSIVIGRAVLVTRKGGTGAVKLKLSKAAGKALRKVKSVTLMLRVVVRNASRTNPTSTSLLSTFVLRH